MAKPTLEGKSGLQSPCVCVWLNSLAAPVKDSIIQMISTLTSILTTIIQFIKLVGTLVCNLDKEIAIYAMQAAIEAEQALIRPAQQPFNMLVKLTKPYSDCDYINTFVKGTKKIKNMTFGWIEKKVRDMEDMIDALEDKQVELDQLDNLISMLNDFNRTLSEFCGTD